MAGLSLFIWAALGVAVGIGKAVENHEMKKFSYKIDEKGRPTWVDRKGQQYIDGERVVATYDYDKHKLVYAGQRTGTVYIDPEQNRISRIDADSEKRKQEAIKEGKLAYMRYDHDRKKQITCEISTEKYIAQLEGRKDGTYWKYYLSPNAKYLNDKTPGDHGIQITQDEYDKLNIFMGTHFASDLNRCTYDSKLKYVRRYKPLVTKENLPKVPN